MTEQEKKIKELEEKKKKKKKVDPNKKLISEDGTLSSFGFDDNYEN